LTSKIVRYVGFGFLSEVHEWISSFRCFAMGTIIRIVSMGFELFRYSMKNISNLMWGFARMEFYDQALFSAVAARVSRMLEV